MNGVQNIVFEDSEYGSGLNGIKTTYVCTIYYSAVELWGFPNNMKEELTHYMIEISVNNEFVLLGQHIWFGGDWDFMWADTVPEVKFYKKEPETILEQKGEEGGPRITWFEAEHEIIKK
jgi:hypothetical protein